MSAVTGVGAAYVGVTRVEVDIVRVELDCSLMQAQKVAEQRKALLIVNADAFIDEPLRAVLVWLVGRA